jgi:hypothetical protein
MVWNKNTAVSLAREYNKIEESHGASSCRMVVLKLAFAEEANQSHGWCRAVIEGTIRILGE